MSDNPDTKGCYEGDMLPQLDNLEQRINELDRRTKVLYWKYLQNRLSRKLFECDDYHPWIKF